MCNSVTPWTAALQAPPMGFSGKHTGVGARFLLREVFPTQASNPRLRASPALTGRFFTTLCQLEALWIVCYAFLIKLRCISISQLFHFSNRRRSSSSGLKAFTAKTQYVWHTTWAVGGHAEETQT